MIQRTTSIDEDTGEILRETSKRFNVFDADKGYLFWANAHQRRSYNKVKLSDAISDTLDFARVHLLAENIYKDTNTIMVRVSSTVVRVADIEDISAMIRLSPKRTKECLYRMLKLHVLAERTDRIGDIVQTKYVLNPIFFNSKKYISSDLYFLFQETLDCYLPTWVIVKFHEIGNIKKEMTPK
jgi:hypothetical protein